jgi:Na+/proline symporter
MARDPSLLLPYLSFVKGTLICEAGALLFSMFFAHRGSAPLVPLGFVGVLGAVAYRYGAAASTLGGVLAAITFAYFLFSPIGSPQIDIEGAKESIGWMILVGLPVCYFVAASRREKDRRSEEPKGKGDA